MGVMVLSQYGGFDGAMGSIMEYGTGLEVSAKKQEKKEGDGGEDGHGRRSGERRSQGEDLS